MFQHRYMVPDISPAVFSTETLDPSNSKSVFARKEMPKIGGLGRQRKLIPKAKKTRTMR